MKRQQGITLAEVLITVLITAFGIVGLVSLQLSASTSRPASQ
ncbi:type IV pilus modification PilV family protein [Kistimonas asteriae]|nr:prepilin-type N-terminal cleavage/methylation domain-containing protein [Kistimonas asteriae]